MLPRFYLRYIQQPVYYLDYLVMHAFFFHWQVG